MPNKLYQMYVPKVFKALDGVISVSRATKQECIARGMDPEKGNVIGNGYDAYFAEALPHVAEENHIWRKNFALH